MFVFGICIGSEEKYKNCVLSSISKFIESGAIIVETRNQESIHLAYNSIINKVSEFNNVEGLILLHDDMEVRDSHLLQKLSKAFQSPDVAIVGAVGSVNVSTLAWWLGEVRGVMRDTFRKVERVDGPHEVDTVDGSFFVMSPWAIKNIRFDSDGYGGFHGYDADICFSARAAGKKVIWEEFDLFHHCKNGVGNVASWLANNDYFRTKWVHAASTERVDSDGNALTPVMLQLGVRSDYRKGWIDLENKRGEDSLHKLVKDVPWPFENSSVDAIFVQNVLQKISAGYERVNFMNESWRILKPGSSIEIIVPRFPGVPSIADPMNISFHTYQVS